MTVPRLVDHDHAFPNGNVHRHSHPLSEGHPEAVNKAHPQPYYFLCLDCEPPRAAIARSKANRRIDEEWGREAQKEPQP